MPRLLSFTLSLPLLLLGCGDKSDATDSGAPDTDDSAEPDTDLPSSYAFESALTGQDSVSYSGQVFRQLLIEDMKTYLGGLTARLDGGSYFPSEGDVAADLVFYFEFDSSTSGAVPHDFSTALPALQETYDDVSSSKNLVEKLAGNDPVGQHADWSTDFVGWDADGVTSPESLVRLWFAQVDAQAAAWVAGDVPLDPWGTPVPAVYVTPEGQDLQQLLEKFLRGAIAFSQGADDYLDDDEPGKGLLSDHTAAEDGAPYTALEHAWDEGFGYFGAAKTYPQWSDQEISDTPTADRDGDGRVDLLTEVCWGHSTNAAKRDLGSASGAPTDYTAAAWEGFARGRQLLAETAGTSLTSAQSAELAGYRDQAVQAWEQAIAATAVHYINDVLKDMGKADTDAYSFADHAKHWSELKGFALSLQFSPASPLSDEDFAALQGHLGTAPVLPTAGPAALDDYAADLRAARVLLADAYGFDASNLGDDNGEGGW